MDHVNVNRVALTALGAVLFVMLLTASSNLLLSPRTPKVPGFALPAAGPRPDRRGAKAAPETPLPVLLAKADVAKGENDVKVCADLPQFQGRRRRQNRAGSVERGRASGRIVPGLRLFRFAQGDRRRLDLR